MIKYRQLGVATDSFNFYIFSRGYGMYIKKINPYNLTYCDIDKKVTRVKVLIFNSENKILLCNQT